MKAKFSLLITSARISALFLGLLLVFVSDAGLVQAYINNGYQDPIQKVVQTEVTSISNSDPEQPDPTITPSPTPTNSPTNTPTSTPTNTPTSTPTPTLISYSRPIIVVKDYSLAESVARPGENVTLNFKLRNAGQATAHNILVIFEAGDLIPLETGGVKAVSQLAAGEVVHIQQTLKVSSGLSGVDNIPLIIRVTYVDDRSANFEETFTLSFLVEQPVYYQPLPTATPEREANPKLIITAYRFDQLPLEAGMKFNLELDVINIGGKSARDITMILGGGSVDYADLGTATGGITGAAGDFSSFAPYNAGNLRFVGDLPSKDTLTLVCPMIVNTNTTPGVHPFKISFAYSDDEETQSYLDDQIITILVHRIPRVEFGFYRDPESFQVGTTGVLPIQILNFGSEDLQAISLVLSADQGVVNPLVVQVGSIEPGGYFTQDFNIVPGQSGDLTIKMILNYIDDFNQEQTIEKAMTFTVEAKQETQLEEPEIPNAESNGSDSSGAERTNFLAVLWRFLLGLLGLNSGG